MARILFIDDDPFTLETLMKAVAVFGHQALVAATGNEGLLAASTQSPDLIFTDMRLPDMDGLELIAGLKNKPETAEIPVMILSASPVMDAVEKAKAAGAQMYIEKPLRLQTLQEIIHQYAME
ncbi:MAG: response regulator [Anaerolineales bacterium]|nr:response regulator [Anaerolineales bacterium]